MSGLKLLAACVCSCADERKQEQRGKCAYARAHDERRLRAAPVPENAHQQRSGKHSNAESKIIQPVSRPALLWPHEVCDERLLRSFSQAKIDSVDEKERPGHPDCRDKSEAEINGCVEQPTGNDQRPATQTVRQISADE